MFTASFADAFALAWFLASWGIYTYVADSNSSRTPTILKAMRIHRHEWMARVVARDQRIMDCYLLSTLTNTNTFFASTTILILGGLIALLGTTEKIMMIVAELPFAKYASEAVWEVKILLLIVIFVYVFFKFSWSIRQFTFVSILIGSAPEQNKDSEEACANFIKRAAHILSLAGNNFNAGLRGYYFGLAALAWFIHPWLLVTASIGVVLVLYRQEFRSSTLKILVGK